MTIADVAGATRLLRLAVTLAVALLAAASPAAAQTDTLSPTDTLVPDTGVVAPDSAAQVPEAVSDAQSDIDEAVRSRLQAIFDRVEALTDVTVEVEAGIVRLRGTVADSRAAERAAELAAEQEGVLWVENGIELTASLSERLEPTWERLQDLGYGAVARLPLLAVALLLVGLSMTLGSALGRWGGPSFLRSRNPFLQNIVGRAIQTMVVLAGILVALDLLDATALVGAVAGTAGLAGLALGFAFKDIVENYLAGLLLALRRPFDANDHVVVESFEGKVVRLTPRETILMTLEGNHVRVPNAMVFRSPMLNYTRNPRRRFQFDAGVGPADDLALARETGMAVLREMAGVLDDPPPEALVMELGDSWVSIRFMGWVDQRRADFVRVRSEAIRLVKMRLEDVGVSLPSPEYLVRLARAGAEPEAPPGAPKPPAPPVDESQADVSVDDAVDRQIEEDRRANPEEDLLGGSQERS